MCKVLSFRITGKKCNSSPRAKPLAQKACTEKTKATFLQSQKMLATSHHPRGTRMPGRDKPAQPWCWAVKDVIHGSHPRGALNGWNGVNGSDRPEVQRAACEKIAFSFQHAKETTEKLLFSFFSSTRQSRWLTLCYRGLARKRLLWFLPVSFLTTKGPIHLG